MQNATSSNARERAEHQPTPSAAAAGLPESPRAARPARATPRGSRRRGAARSPPRAPCRRRKLAVTARLRAIDGEGDRAPAIEVERVLQPPAQAIAQSDQFGALREGAVLPRLDDGVAALAAAQDFGRGRAVDEPRARSEQEHEARLVEAGGRDDRIAAIGIADEIGQRCAREDRPHQRHRDAERRDRHEQHAERCAQQRTLRALHVIEAPGIEAEDQARPRRTARRASRTGRGCRAPARPRRPGSRRRRSATSR